MAAHYIHAEKLRHTNTEAVAALPRHGRYRTVAGNLRVKENHGAPGSGIGPAAGGVRAERFVVCHDSPSRPPGAPLYTTTWWRTYAA